MHYIHILSTRTYIYIHIYIHIYICTPTSVGLWPGPLGMNAIHLVVIGGGRPITDACDGRNMQQRSKNPGFGRFTNVDEAHLTNCL